MANGRLAHRRVGVLRNGEVGRRLAAGSAVPTSAGLQRLTSAASKARVSWRRSASCGSRLAVHAVSGTTASKLLVG
jgi:hypothetical protein